MEITTSFAGRRCPFFFILRRSLQCIEDPPLSRRPATVVQFSSATTATLLQSIMLYIVVRINQPTNNNAIKISRQTVNAQKEAYATETPATCTPEEPARDGHDYADAHQCTIILCGTHPIESHNDYYYYCNSTTNTIFTRGRLATSPVDSSCCTSTRAAISARLYLLKPSMPNTRSCHTT